MIEALEKKPAAKVTRKKPPVLKNGNDAQPFTGQRKKTGLLTISEVEKMQIARPFELVNGRIVEKMPNFMHGRLQSEISFYIRLYLESNAIGELAGNANYRIEPDKALESKAPDISFVRKERLPDALDTFLNLAPDLAVEIVSPTDAAEDVFDKAGYYLAHGVQEVWLVFPRAKMIVIYRPDGISKADKTLTSQLLPGFELNVKALFAEKGR